MFQGLMLFGDDVADILFSRRIASMLPPEERAKPQGLKPIASWVFNGTAKAVPFQNNLRDGFSIIFAVGLVFCAEPISCAGLISCVEQESAPAL
jgi:hypothetical protein